MPVLLAPWALIALAALAVPVLIHWVRRSERQEVMFAALRWLGRANRPRQQRYLHDLPLLLLRLLLLATLALLLAAPARESHGEPGSASVLVSPAIDAAAARAAVAAPTADWRWLAPGFPPLDAPRPLPSPPASLIREADAQLPRGTRLTVVIPQTIDAPDAGALRLAHAVTWTPLPGPSSPAAEPARPPPPLQLAIHGAAGHADSLRVVRALAAAWRAGGREVRLDETPAGPPASDTALQIRLDVSEPDAATLRWVEQGGRLLVTAAGRTSGVVVLTDESGRPLLYEAAVGRGHRFSMPAALTPAAVPALADPSFPRRLLAALLPAPASAATAEARQLQPQTIEPAPPGPYRPLAPALALAAALLFLLERLWASRRRSAAA